MSAETVSIGRRRALLALPVGIAVTGGIGFWAMLQGMKSGAFDPRGVPSPITGKHIPAFDLPAQAPGPGFASTDLGRGSPVLLNFFASWCVPCAQENPALLSLAAQGMPIWGIAYKDPADKAAAYLAQHGNPYKRIAADADGRVAIDFGLSGVPESYLVDGRGVVQWHWANGLNEDVIKSRLQPVWRAVS